MMQQHNLASLYKASNKVTDMNFTFLKKLMQKDDRRVAAKKTFLNY